MKWIVKCLIGQKIARGKRCLSPFPLTNNEIRDTVFGRYEQRDTRYERGFTIIELIIVIVIAGIISGIFGMLILQVIDVYSFVTVREDVLSEAELAMERMVREMRQIQKAAQTIEVIYLADGAEFQFVDVDDNIIGFKRNGSDLNRMEFSEPGVLQYDDLLADDITNMAFTYWDEDNDELSSTPLSSADIEKIKRIEISIEMERQDQEVRIDTQVYPRNL